MRFAKTRLHSMAFCIPVKFSTVYVLVKFAADKKKTYILMELALLGQHIYHTINVGRDETDSSGLQT